MISSPMQSDLDGPILLFCASATGGLDGVGGARYMTRGTYHVHYIRQTPRHAFCALFPVRHLDICASDSIRFCRAFQRRLATKLTGQLLHVLEEIHQKLVIVVDEIEQRQRLDGQLDIQRRLLVPLSTVLCVLGTRSLIRRL